MTLAARLGALAALLSLWPGCGSTLAPERLGKGGSGSPIDAFGPAQPMEDAEDRRHRPTDCEVDEDCRDADPCTPEVCRKGQCSLEVPLGSAAFDQLGALSGLRDITAIDLTRRTLAVATAASIIDIFDVRDLLEIVHVAQLTVGSAAVTVQLTGPGLVAATGPGGLQLFDAPAWTAAGQTAPRTGALHNIKERVDAVVAGRGPVIVAGYDAGFSLVNLEDPSSPTLVEHFDTAGRAVGGYNAPNGWGLVADSLGGLVTFHKAEPELGKVFTTEGRVVDVAGHGPTVVAAEWGAGFSLYDYRAPASPTHLSRVATAKPVVAVEMLGRFSALVLLEDATLGLLSTLDGSSPVAVATWQPATPTGAIAMALAGDTIALALDSGEVIFLSSACP